MQHVALGSSYSGVGRACKMCAEESAVSRVALSAPDATRPTCRQSSSPQAALPSIQHVALGSSNSGVGRACKCAQKWQRRLQGGAVSAGRDAPYMPANLTPTGSPAFHSACCIGIFRLLAWGLACKMCVEGGSAVSRVALSARVRDVPYMRDSNVRIPTGRALPSIQHVALGSPKMTERGITGPIKCAQRWQCRLHLLGYIPPQLLEDATCPTCGQNSSPQAALPLHSACCIGIFKYFWRGPGRFKCAQRWPVLSPGWRCQ